MEDEGAEGVEGVDFFMSEIKLYAKGGAECILRLMTFSNFNFLRRGRLRVRAAGDSDADGSGPKGLGPNDSGPKGLGPDGSGPDETVRSGGSDETVGSGGSGGSGGLTHLDESGSARMVDVGGKAATLRTAKAAGTIWMSAEAFGILAGGGAAKGDVLAAARIAAIGAAKRTWELVPLCHVLALESAAASFHPDAAACAVRCEMTVRAFGKTGVEMEALAGASVGLLTIYDMLKAVDRGMTIGGIRLLEKRGGKSGTFLRAEGGSEPKGPESPK